MFRISSKRLPTLASRAFQHSLNEYLRNHRDEPGRVSRYALQRFRQCTLRLGLLKQARHKQAYANLLPRHQESFSPGTNLKQCTQEMFPQTSAQRGATREISPGVCKSETQRTLGWRQCTLRLELSDQRTLR